MQVITRACRGLELYSGSSLPKQILNEEARLHFQKKLKDCIVRYEPAAICVSLAARECLENLKSAAPTMRRHSRLHVNWTRCSGH